MNGLYVSAVPRCLELKTKLYGFEVEDVLIILSYLSISNLFLGTSHLKYLVVWIGTLILATTLYFVKRNRPENYLAHKVQYLLSSELLCAHRVSMTFVYYPREFEND